MITNFKLFESNNKPIVGEYALLKHIYIAGQSAGTTSLVNKFIDNNICEIINYDNKTNNYRVSYDDIPKYYYGYTDRDYFIVSLDDIIFYGTKEECEKEIMKRKLKNKYKI